MQSPLNLLRRDIPLYDGALFSWCGRKGVVKASTLRKAPKAPSRPLQPLYESSTELGFGVRSHKTGKKKLFILEKVVYDKDDLIQWELRSGCGDISITVYND